MHELSLMADLLEKVGQLASENGAARVMSVDITIGALAGISEDHLKEHWREASIGTIAEGAELRTTVSEDPLSTGLVLQSLELET